LIVKQQSVISSQKENGYEETNGGVAGRAGGNSATGGGKPTKLSEVVSQWEKDGKNVGSAEFQAHVITLKKENKEFDLAS
jgi:hypothetical protein